MIYVAIIAGIFLMDLLIKNHIENMDEFKKSPGTEQKLLGGLILLRKYHNTGLTLDFLDKHRKVVRVLSLIMAILITILFIISFGKCGKPILRFGFSLLLGGAYSNTYDRLYRKYVVDYVGFPVKWKRLRNITFNVSDFCIIIGALLLVLGTEK